MVDLLFLPPPPPLFCPHLITGNSPFQLACLLRTEPPASCQAQTLNLPDSPRILCSLLFFSRLGPISSRPKTAGKKPVQPPRPPQSASLLIAAWVDSSRSPQTRAAVPRRSPHCLEMPAGSPTPWGGGGYVSQTHRRMFAAFYSGLSFMPQILRPPISA